MSYLRSLSPEALTNAAPKSGTNSAIVPKLPKTQIHFHVSYCFVTVNIFGVIPFYFIVLYLVASQIHHRPTHCGGNKQTGISDTFIFLNHA